MLAFKVKLLLSCFVAFVALVNPIQKVFIITSLQSQFNSKELRIIAIKSTITALIILIFFLLVGEVVFSYAFHIEIYAFQVTCGAVLFYNGISGLQKGDFLNVDKNVTIKDITVVPIAMPMIAGPATITAAVTLPADYGHTNTIVSIVAALAINLVFMIYARSIGGFLSRLNLLNPLIRIFGLIVATIGVQMVFNGLLGFIKAASSS
jgi:multiple antibiotic resistance protein